MAHLKNNPQPIRAAIDTVSSCQKMAIRNECGTTGMDPAFIITEFSKAGHPRPVTNKVLFNIIFRSGNEAVA